MDKNSDGIEMLLINNLSDLYSHSQLVVKSSEVIRAIPGRYGMLRPFFASELATVMPSKTPTLTREGIEPRLDATGLPSQDIGSMLSRVEWRALESRNQQFVFLCDRARLKRGATLSGAVTARVFAIKAFQVWKIRSTTKDRSNCQIDL
jgi:hypothetical protein